MEILAIVLGILLILLGITFSVLPPIPGPPFALGGLLLLHFLHDGVTFSSTFLIIMTIATALILILDYLVPIWGTKKFGGTKAGVRGSIVGLILGLIFMGPLGIILGPFLGALIAELITGNDMNTAFKSGFGSFIGFLLGTGLKLGISILMSIQFIKALI